MSMATVGGFTVRGFSNPMLAPLLNGVGEDRVLVVVQLYGGNDGLSTVIPIDQYQLLSQFRSNVLVPETSVLPLSVEVPRAVGAMLASALAVHLLQWILRKTPEDLLKLRKGG